MWKNRKKKRFPKSLGDHNKLKSSVKIQISNYPSPTITVGRVVHRISRTGTYILKFTGTCATCKVLVQILCAGIILASTCAGPTSRYLQAL